jgi:hypothetical protein
VRARATGHDADLAADDHVQVLLSSGGAFVQIAANLNGAVVDSMGNTPAGRPWGADSWDGGAEARGFREAGAWRLRLNIPLAAVAAALDEPGLPQRIRILIRRARPARDGSPAETSTWPALESATVLAPARYANLRLLAAGVAALSPAPPPTLSGPAARIAALEPQVWPPAERKKLRPEQMLERNLRTRLAAVAAEERRSWESVRTLDDWRHFREKRLSALRNWIGPFPERHSRHRAGALPSRRQNAG